MPEAPRRPAALPLSEEAGSAAKPALPAAPSARKAKAGAEPLPSNRKAPAAGKLKLPQPADAGGKEGQLSHRKAGAASDGATAAAAPSQLSARKTAPAGKLRLPAEGGGGAGQTSHRKAGGEGRRKG